MYRNEARLPSHLSSPIGRSSNNTLRQCQHSARARGRQTQTLGHISKDLRDVLAPAPEPPTGHMTQQASQPLRLAQKVGQCKLEHKVRQARGGKLAAREESRPGGAVMVFRRRVVRA